MSSNLLAKGYEPHAVEKHWYNFWETNGLFAAPEKSEGNSYSIVIPPPNVTGVLHMGHALNNTLQDILCRYRRLRGDNVLWMPGTDHAGIATQNVVEKSLAEQGKDRHQVGREKFIEAVWEWRKAYGSAIINQLKRLGASCDWDRERFTMDDGLSKAVRKVFVQLYDEGLIYRDKYIINWCPRCNTALADLEVEHEEIEGYLYQIKYPLADGNGHLIVATTRPETMLGDTAVAVNPNDERYQNLSCGHVILPLMERKIPIIQDDYVDMEFGTGALKVTPAHDPNDFEIAARHHLESVKVIADDGCMAEEAKDFAGMDRFECRQKVVDALKAQNLLVKIEAHDHSVGHCYRCKAIVEPNLSKQWFVKVKPLAKEAIKAVEEGQTKIIPKAWEKTYFEWMYNIKDWCISRQIWWGHQIPAWTCDQCGKQIVKVDTPTQCPDCGSRELIQETDVLDTWFSSALWPFSTMGWPETTDLLKSYYPTTVLITGFDILFFWVARMMMMGLHFMKDIPFKDVYVHALVRDEHGKKMSKSKGNVIDPLSVIEKYGTDAFRFTLAAFAAQGRDIKLSEARIEGYRHFINKLWNAARFAFMHIDRPYTEIDKEQMTLPDRWILTRLRYVVQETATALDEYRFNEAASLLYRFIWHELCDWYLEAIKPALYGNLNPEVQKNTKAVLWRVLGDTLVLSQPFIPFVTEEIWHKLPGTEGSIMQARFPLDNPQSIINEIDDQEAVTAMNLLINVITAVRNVRGEMNIAPSAELKVTVQSDDDHTVSQLITYQDILINLARLESISVQSTGKRPKSAATTIIEGATVFVSLEGIIDFSKEEIRLEKEIEKASAELEIMFKKLNNDGFIQKAPPQVVDKARQKHADLSEKYDKLHTTLKRLLELQNA